MRRLIVLVFVAMGLVALGAAPAQACDVEPMPRAEQLQSTPFIFSGVVTQARPRSPEAGTTSYTVRVNRVYRGALDETVTVTAPTTVRNCGLREVRRGTQLMFFAEKSQKDVLGTASFLGTTTLTPQVRRDIEESVGTGNLPDGAKDDPASDAEGTVVDDSEPPSVVTAIIPGVGLMLIGILVLVLARIFGRPVRP